MVHYEFTDHAEFDLDSITDFTIEHWGPAQAEKYLDGLEALAQYLAENPNLGMKRDGLFEGLISFPYVSHILYYVKQPQGITVIRVLHNRMDPERQIMKSLGE